MVVPALLVDMYLTGSKSERGEQPSVEAVSDERAGPSFSRPSGALPGARIWSPQPGPPAKPDNAANTL